MKRKLLLFFTLLLSALCLFCSCKAKTDENTAQPTSSSSLSSADNTTQTTAVRRVGVQGVLFEKNELHLTVGERIAVFAKILPDDATERGILYTSSDPAVFTYSNGIVTALASGEALLTAVTVEDGYIARLKVIVSLPKEETTTPTAETTETPVSTETPSVSPVSTVSPASTPIPGAPVIFVDAGHGFTNSKGILDVGAGEGSAYNTLSKDKTGKALYEADLNLQIALKVEELLTRMGYSVIMSRNDYVNEYLPISARAERIKNSGAGLLLSIHANAAANLSACGARVYYNASEDFSASEAGKALASAIIAEIAERCPSPTPPYIVDGRTLAVLNSSGAIPAVLVETCFLTNEDDAKKALDEEWLTSMAQAIVEGALAYLEN